MQRYQWTMAGNDAFRMLTNAGNRLGKDFPKLEKRFGMDIPGGEVGKNNDGGTPGHLTENSVKRILTAMHKHAPFNNNSSVLDIGCNTGWFLMSSVAFGVRDVRGVDINSTAVEAWHTYLPGLKQNADRLGLAFRERVEAVAGGMRGLDARGPMLGPVTHVYSFWAGMSWHDKMAAIQKMLYMPRLRCIALIDQWQTTSRACGEDIRDDMLEAAGIAQEDTGRRLVPVDRFTVTQAGANRQFTCHMYAFKPL